MWKYFGNKKDEVPQVLNTLDIEGVANYIKSDACKNIFVCAGAGISTSAGIPDFRSPETGLYANLARLRLPYPEAVFDISFFRKNPRPFYVLAHELAPGKFRPTLTHSFIRLLSEKGYLHTCFTQNIDTLERRAGVPAEKIIEAHGSFANQHCIDCDEEYPHEKIREKIGNQEIPICDKPGCNGYVKPDIVFFGESLPDEFTSGIRSLTNADLLIVMGTSLTVYPFAKLPELVPEDCPRLLLNLDHVGGWGSRVNDVACLMPCDKAVRELCKKLGWEEELNKLWAETAFSTEGPVETETAKEKLDEVVDGLAEAVGAVKLEDKKEHVADSEDKDSSKPAKEAKEIETEISGLDTGRTKDKPTPSDEAEEVESDTTTEKEDGGKETIANVLFKEPEAATADTSERGNASSEDSGKEDPGGKL